MGTKFGNIHIKTDNTDDVILAIQELVLDKSSVSAKADQLTGYELIVQQANISRNVYYVGVIRNGWISVLNDWFGWGEVEAFGEALSGYISYPMLTCSCFDEDILEINVYNNGEQTTGHVWCSAYAAEDYGLEEKEADVAVLAELLGHEHIAQLMNALNTEDLEQAVREFENITGFPLWIHSDWFSSIQEDPIVKQYKKYDFNA